MTTSRKAKLKALLRRCRNDPVLFNDRVLRRPPCHDVQKQWASALVEHRVLAVETGNMLGKDWFFGGCVIPWWLYTRKNSLVIVTAPSQTLLGSVTWKELRRSIEGCPFVKAGLLPAKLTSGIKTSPQTLEVKPGWQALGFSTTTIERMSGQHAENLLVLVGEASGTEDHVWDAIRGLGYRKMVAYGNPLRAVCGFADLCDRGVIDERDGIPAFKAVKYMNTPSTASPHIHMEDSRVGLASKGWYDEMARMYGKDSLWFKAHVLAIRPKLSHEILIQPEWLDRATSEHAANAAKEWRARKMGGKKRMSCDVGEGVGNSRSVVVVRDDVGIIEIDATAFGGPHETAQRMADLAHKHQVAEENISFDGNGTTGKRLANALPGKGLNGVRPFLGGSTGGKRFSNMRTACAAALQRRLDPDGYSGGKREERPFHIPVTPDIQTILDELRELRGQMDNRGRYALEHKQDFMERLGRSPDYADAITQGFREEAITG